MCTVFFPQNKQKHLWFILCLKHSIKCHQLIQENVLQKYQRTVKRVNVMKAQDIEGIESPTFIR